MGSRGEPLHGGILAGSSTHPQTAIPQHFLLSAEARSMSVREVFALSDGEAFGLFREFRGGKREEVVCPECGVADRHWFLRSRRQWCCKACSIPSV